MRIALYSLLCLILVSCSADPNAAWTDPNAAKDSAAIKKSDSSYTLVPNHVAIKDEKELTDAKGIVGIFIVPEMLALTKLDSAPVSRVALKMSKGFETALADIKAIKAERYGSMGAIYYNNDTANFVFECVVPILKMPKIAPKKSQVVVLEEAKMVVYNYYGSYIFLNDAYEDLRAFCKKNKLEQSGPLREFYITDASMVKDSTQWLTRIMLPVK
jgi:effector-binding domain-containing protein